MKTSTDFLNDCVKVQEERGAEYEGNGKERSFDKVANVFNEKTGYNLKGYHIALILQDLKDVRMFSADRYHEDSLIDSISYASIKAELVYEHYHPK